jgi:hypothetical protein
MLADLLAQMAQFRRNGFKLGFANAKLVVVGFTLDQLADCCVFLLKQGEPEEGLFPAHGEGIVELGPWYCGIQIHS